MSEWSPKRGNSGWRNFLTADELATIVDAERKRQSARQNLAEASAIIAPIQNRAIHRATYARAALGETKAAPEQEPSGA